MKTFCLRLSLILLAGLILINSGSSSAFHKKLPLRGASEAKGFVVVPRNQPRGIFTNLHASNSSSPHSRKHPYYKRTLHSSIQADCDSDSNAVVRVAQNAWGSFSDRLLLLKIRGGILQKKRKGRLFEELSTTRHMATTLAPTNRAPTAATTTKAATRTAFTKADYAVFISYFCNICIVTLGVLTVPAIAAEHNMSPQSAAAFCASMASLAPLGGFVGKLVNGFVCQKIGGQRSSYLYLSIMAALSLGMSFTSSLAPVGIFLVGFDFLCSIQWTAICAVLDANYVRKPKLHARGITILSMASTLGALFAKTFGSGLLQATEWRTVYRCGAIMGLLGASAIYLGGTPPKSRFDNYSVTSVATKVSSGGQQKVSALASLKSVLGNPIFWMIGMGHALGHMARASDKLLTPFLQQVGGISSSMAVTLTSSVTIGFVLGLSGSTIFSNIKSIEGKMKMLKTTYQIAVLSTLGLAACGMQSVASMFNPKSLMAAITLFSGLIATSVSFQFYNIPNLMSSTIFPKSTSVALSLTDAVGFLVTAGVMGVGSLVLGAFGWSATWAFMALIFTMGSASMMRAMHPILQESIKKQR